MGATGLEEPQSRPRKTEVDEKSGINSGNTGAAEAARPDDALAQDAGLLCVVQGWSALPAAVRAGIVAMVRASSGGLAGAEGGA